MKRHVLRLLMVPFLAIGIISIVAIPLIFGGIVWLFTSGPTYDTRHPDYAHFSAAFDRAAEEFGPKGARTTPFDFAALNGGAWKTVCLFGGYSNPLAEMQSWGAVISKADATRLDKDRQGGFRLYAVEEGEAVIAYIDNDNRTHFIHFHSGLGQHVSSPFNGCISKPLTTLILLAD